MSKPKPRAMALTQETLRDLFDCGKNGELVWKVGAGTQKTGNLAGCVCDAGYRVVKIHKRRYYAHRLVLIGIS